MLREHLSSLPGSKPTTGKDNPSASGITLPDQLFGLTPEEYLHLLNLLGRTPNTIELAMVGALWSEHCSYKSSRVWLRELGFPHPLVVQGPGENAGIVRLAPPYCLVFKIESHNHPSFIEPYQGAATGVGGILRDILAMGARPVALANSLRFGDPGDPRTPFFLKGVVKGIGDYGNCVGIPTLAGETGFARGYNQNILVNALALGVVRDEEILFARARKPGSYLVLLGNRTGRDGIQGAVMASRSFGKEVEADRPKVQIADPFLEKLLIEACLRMRDLGYLEALQDLGAAGLTSAGFEVAAKGKVGILVHLDEVPLREPGLSPLEILLSESQERMLLVIPPRAWSGVKEIADHWNLECARIGEVTATHSFQATFRGELCVDLPVEKLLEEMPLYHRPHRPRPPSAFHLPPPRRSISEELLALLAHPQLASKHWVYEQYDSTVQGNTLRGPGGDAGVAWVPEAQVAFALTLEGNARIVTVDPYLGIQHIVAEGVRNLYCVGATPLGVTDGLNFGNPEHPEVMEDFIQVVRGLRTALEYLRIPVVSGNVSFYNETGGRNIPSTPILGFVGKVEVPLNCIPYHYLNDSGIKLYLLGDCDPLTLVGSAYADLLYEAVGGVLTPPHLDQLEPLRQVLFTAMKEGILRLCHDLGEGGLLIALSEISYPKGIGFRLNPDLACRPREFWFGEGAQVFLVGVTPEGEERLLDLCRSHGVPLHYLGESAGDELIIPGILQYPIRTLKISSMSALANLFSGTSA